MAELNGSKLKKIAQISAERASREAAELQTSSMRFDRTRDLRSLGKLLEKNVDGFASFSREFDALTARNEANAETQIEELREHALKIACSRELSLASMVAQRVKALEALAAVPSAQRYLVNTPIEIVADQLNLDSFAIVPSNSWAKFKFNWRRTKQRNCGVSFRFVWQNPTDKYVVINANGFMTLNGLCYLNSDGGWLAGDRAATLTMRVALGLFDWTTEPYPQFPGTEEIVAVDMQRDTGGMFDDWDGDQKDVFRGYDLLNSLALVPPSTAVGLVMTLAMHVYTGQDSGTVLADFSTGSYRVGSPAVLVSVLS
jgi:hypothetical protein